ncbi:hypothetical protein [Photobacterium leiognathi]|uniref:hypothetical protein n=1 Tax=Photobacterium leiognathi TaxID=553611 RepID=UPI0029825264|nr:hypothetical protein [Photobacterium leiognathi]
MILSKIVHFSSVSCAAVACTRLLWLNNFSLERVQYDTLVIHAQSAAMLPMALILLDESAPINGKSFSIDFNAGFRGKMIHCQ